jgi:tryptophan synthase alpha chain
MDRIRNTFHRLRRARRTALIPFVMGGDPDLETTERLLMALEASGADLIEVGIPFSDPLADGPIIQRASSRALSRGATPPAILHAIARASTRLRVPVVVLSYWNPVARDPRAFVRMAAQAGVSGIVVPDLPPEEAGAFRPIAKRAGVATIFLAAPTSPPSRLRQIVRASEGFIYYVSVTGTTGVRATVSHELAHHVRQLKLLTTKPICVGFGISSPAQAAAVARVADGVIIGSALIRAMEPHLKHRAAAVRAAGRFVRRLRHAL